MLWIALKQVRNPAQEKHNTLSSSTVAGRTLLPIKSYNQKGEKAKLQLALSETALWSYHSVADTKGTCTIQNSV